MRSIVLAVVLAAVLAASPAAAQTDRDRALSLVAFGVFVKDYCPGIRPNLPRFETKLAELGVPRAALREPSGPEAIASRVEIFAVEAEASCNLAWSLYGESGTNVPGLVLRRERNDR